MEMLKAIYPYVPLIWIGTAVIRAATGDWFSSFLSLQLAFVTFIHQP